LLSLHTKLFSNYIHPEAVVNGYIFRITEDTLTSDFRLVVDIVLISQKSEVTLKVQFGLSRGHMIDTDNDFVGFLSTFQRVKVKGF